MSVMSNRIRITIGGFLMMLMSPIADTPSLWAYPLDEHERTGMRRLKWQQEVNAGKKRGTKLPDGGLWTSPQIRLRMLTKRKFDITSDTPKDPMLQNGLESILARQAWKRYSIALLDISDPSRPRYAAVDQDREQTPGSVAKVLVAAALLNELGKLFPQDIKKREKLLKETMVTADNWAMPNSHEVPVVNGDKVAIRSIRRGDTFSLWEWMDHAISPSSNAAGTTVWREAILLGLLGTSYPPSGRIAELWRKWDRKSFTQAAFMAVDTPQASAGLDPGCFRLRAFFTRGGSPYIHSESSRTSPMALLRWMLRMEQGRMVDEWSSLELKRLLYVTRRRIRYASTPELTESAVFFKSGSLYKCKPEPGFNCGKYRGNAVNILNSINIVETMPKETKGSEAPQPIVYLVAVMSNELKRNASFDHRQLAGQIHNLILER